MFGSFPLLAQQGHRDTTFNIGTGANNITQRLELLYDQSVFAGGDFTSFGGTTFKRLKRLTPSGTSFTGWAPHTPTTGGADGPVRASAVQTNGQLLIGGLFNTVNGTASKNFARLDTSGIVDGAFNIGIGFNNEVTSIASNGSRIFAAGFFSAYKGVSVPNFVCLNMSGDIDTTWFKPTGFLSVESIVPAPGGKVYIGGSFTSYNGMAINRVARLNTDGTLDTSFNTGTGVTGGNVQTMCIQPDGKLIIAGSFSAVNGTPNIRIARLNTNGSVDPIFNAGTGANSNIRALALQQNTGKIYIGGDFTTINGVSRPRIARLLSDGILDTAFSVGSGTNGTVYSILVQHDGNVLISGNFSQYNGVTVGKMVRLIGDSSTALPVSLLNLNAVKINEHEVLLSWQTASETNNSHFEIERSADNKTFEYLANVKGAGNSATLTHYSYKDNAGADFSEEVLYYRLKQVDYNGKYAFSNVVTIGSFKTKRPSMNVFPNPAGDNITVKGVSGNGAILYDITGKALIAIPTDGSYHTGLLKQGLYFIKNENAAIKLVIE